MSLPWALERHIEKEERQSQRHPSSLESFCGPYVDLYMWITTVSVFFFSFVVLMAKILAEEKPFCLALVEELCVVLKDSSF